MNNISLPNKIEFKASENKNQELIVIESLYPGYGATLGSTIRRVLLSSLPGAAVVGVKIKGAKHEFMAIPNIKEDVLSIILNLKKLKLKVFTDEIVKLTLSVSGKKEVTGADIDKNSDVEIVSKDEVIANITDNSGSLEMEIFVSAGRGYETVEEREDRKKEVDYIAIDSLFSPVIAVGVKVENTRVGKMTNWDKLILDITTNGTLSPREAFELALAIVIDQFKSMMDLINKKEDAPEEVKEEEPEEVEEIKTKKEKKRNKIKN